MSNCTSRSDYAYSPYGEVATLGPDGGNSLQYTGQENDGTGLHFYYTRYYDPVLKQFLSEDGIGILGGLNLRAYVNGAPTMYVDPFGHEPGTLAQRGYPSFHNAGIGPFEPIDYMSAGEPVGVMPPPPTATGPVCFALCIGAKTVVGHFSSEATAATGSMLYRHYRKTSYLLKACSTNPVGAIIGVGLAIPVCTSLCGYSMPVGSTSAGLGDIQAP